MTIEHGWDLKTPIAPIVGYTQMGDHWGFDRYGLILVYI